MVDVIIPTYNSRKTIETTIMSLALQRLSKELSITIVDDGSTDGTDFDELKAKYVKFFEGFTVIKLGENHGVGYARQVGIRNTRNPWIYFIDSDDIMTQCYSFNRLIRAAIANPETMIVFSNVVQESDISNSMRHAHGEIATYTNHDGNKEYLHGKLYSRFFIMTNGITFANTRSNEDIAFNLAYFTLCNPNNIARVEYSTVITIFNPNSITRNKKSTRLYSHTNVNEIMDAYTACRHAFKEVCRKLGNNVSPTTCKYFIQKYVHIFTKCILGKFDNPEDKELYQMIVILYYRDIIKPILTSNGIDRKLDNRVMRSGDFNYWSDETYGTYPFPNIHDWSESHLNQFTNERFNELASIKLTEVGYIG